ncbi:MAG: alternative ribosome rescue aminoacyl-tRNA hydrolase ArfB [bacterium]
MTVIFRVDNNSSIMELYLKITDSLTIPIGELKFRSSRSSGPGGQNVNKLETKVELLFDIQFSPSLSPEQQLLLMLRLGGRIDQDGVLHLSASESRSQWKNKQEVIGKFIKLIQLALKPRKKRLKTSRTRASNEVRLKSKKLRSEKKSSRKRHSEL